MNSVWLYGIAKQLNTKSCIMLIGSPTIPLDLTLSDLEGQIQGHSDVEALYLAKRLRDGIC